MTVLSWRDVATPDMRGIQDGFGAAADLFTSGMGALRGTVKDLKDSKVNSQSTAMLAELAAIQDPAKAKEAMPAILAKYDPRYIDQAAIGTAMGRPGALLKQAADESAYNETQKLIKDSDFIRDHAPLINQFKSLATKPERDAFVTEHKDIFDQMHPRAFQDMTEDNLDITSYDLRNYGTALRNLSDKTDYDNGVTDRSEGRGMRRLESALSVFADHGAKQRYINSDDGFNAAAKEYGLQVASEMRTRLNSSDGSSDAAGGAGGGSGGGSFNAEAGDGLRVMNYEARASGFGTVPDSVKTMGDASKFALQVNAANKARMGTPGSSAMGTYQVTGETMREFGPKALGAGWETAEYSLENMDKIGKAIFEEAKKEGPQKLMSRWAALDAKEAAQLMNMSWEDGRIMIAQQESGGDPRGMAIKSDVATASSVGGDPLKDMIRRSVSNGSLEDTTPSAELASAAVTKKGGTFFGQDVNRVQELIEKTRNLARKKGEHPISAKMAIEILEQSSVGEEGFFEQVGDNITNFFGGPGDGISKQLNWDQVEQLVKTVRDPNALGDAAVDVDRTNQARSGSAQAVQQLATLNTQFAAAMSNAEDTGKKVDVEHWLSKARKITGGADVALKNGAIVALQQAAAAYPDRGPEPTTPNAPTRKAPVTAKPVTPVGKKVDGIFASSVSQSEARRDPLPTAKDINMELAKYKSAAQAWNAVRNRPPAAKAGEWQQLNAATNRVLSSAIRSGLPQFQRKPNESAAAHQARVKSLLIRN
jgi:hypothetical protein